MTTLDSRPRAATTPDRPAPPQRRAGRPRRLDALDGLRTIAVLLVVAYHLDVPGTAGGFLGVDVFFVLSGYLITSLLLRQITSRGHADLAGFWKRRVLRLMPAAVLVIVAVLVWAVVAAPAYRRAAVGQDALWSLLYVGNWRFISTATYFADDGTTSPLEHVWSLAVEEQFYLAWPLVVATVAALVVRVRAGRERVRGTGVADTAGDSAERAERSAARRLAICTAVLVVAGVLAAASAVLMAVLADPAAPERAYMGTDTKAFEPLIGAAAAALMMRPRVRTWVTARSQPLIVAGLLGVVAGVALLGGAHAPAPGYFTGGAAAFALGCAVLVAATSVADRRRGLTLVLGSTPVAYIGRISYGVYLWHWPIVVWLVGEDGFRPGAALLAFALTLLAASASYHLVEAPIRTGRLAHARPGPVFARAATSIAAVVAATAFLGGSPLNPLLPVATSAPMTAPNSGNVVVVGDSVVQRLLPALASAADARGLTVLSGARGGCPVLDVRTVAADGTPDAGCGAPVAERQSAVIDSARPGLVIWWSRYELADRIGPDGRVLRAGTAAFWAAQRADLAAAVDRLTVHGARLVIVEVEPVGRGIDSRCRPGACHPFLARLRDDDRLRQTWNGILREVAARDDRVRLVRVGDLVCRDGANPCDDRGPVRQVQQLAFAPVDGEGFARPDGSHFSPAAMPTMATDLLDRVAAATVGGRTS